MYESMRVVLPDFQSDSRYVQNFLGSSRKFSALLCFAYKVLNNQYPVRSELKTSR